MEGRKEGKKKKGKEGRKERRINGCKKLIDKMQNKELEKHTKE